MDFTPGIFDLLHRARHRTAAPPDEPRPRTTLAKQLALYVVLYSPLQMAADLRRTTPAQPAFQFIRDVAVDWDTTRVLDGRIGDYVAVARRERGGRAWFVGAITDEAARTLDVPLSFLTPGKQYVAEIYADGPGANWFDNPLPVTIYATHGDVRDAAARRAGAGWGTGDPHPASEVTPVHSQLPTPSVDGDVAQSPMQAATATLARKPTLTFWEIWNMSFGFLGIQIGFALQNANVSRIFETLGAKVEDIPLLWIAAP